MNNDDVRVVEKYVNDIYTIIYNKILIWIN